MQEHEHPKGYRGRQWVYFCDDNRGRIKIGYSLQPWARIHEFQTINPEIEMISIHTGDRETEQQYHERFDDERICGEWFLKSDRLLDWIGLLEAIGNVDQRLKAKNL